MSASSPVALILGAGPRVGHHVSHAFAAKGYKIALVARSAKEEESTSEQLLVRGDFSDPGSIAGIFEKVKSELGVPHVVVYNGMRTPNDSTSHNSSFNSCCLNSPRPKDSSRCSARWLCSKPFYQHHQCLCSRPASRNWFRASPGDYGADIHLYWQLHQRGANCSAHGRECRQVCYSLHHTDCRGSIRKQRLQVSCHPYIIYLHGLTHLTSQILLCGWAKCGRLTCLWCDWWPCACWVLHAASWGKETRTMATDLC